MRHHRKIAAAAVGVLLTSASPASALFGIGDVVWDPAAEIKNVAKIAAMLDELQQMRRQYEQLRQQIEDLSGLLDDPGGDAFDRAGDALDALTQLDSTLDDWRERLPIDVEPDDIARGDMPARQSQVRAYLRERIAHARHGTRHRRSGARSHPLRKSHRLSRQATTLPARRRRSRLRTSCRP